MGVLELLDTSPPAVMAARDVRYIVCGYPVSARGEAGYLSARSQVLEEMAAGNDARIVLVTNRSHDTTNLPLDIPVDILPVFFYAEPGKGAQINRAIFPCIFSSARANTVFYIYDNGHPILNSIRRSMRARGICYFDTPPDSAS
jgi:hypothetical protein